MGDSSDILFERNDELGYYEEIRNNKGQFTEKDLNTYWSDYGDKERALFLEFMLTCGMCFEVKKERYESKSFEERIFIAPEMMEKGPPESFVIQQKEWEDEDIAVLKIRYQSVSYTHLTLPTICSV